MILATETLITDVPEKEQPDPLSAPEESASSAWKK